MSLAARLDLLSMFSPRGGFYFRYYSIYYLYSLVHSILVAVHKKMGGWVKLFLYNIFVSSVTH